MNVIALDTASPDPAVSVVSRGTVWDERLPADRQASEHLLDAVRRCLGRAGLALTDCERIAVCAGPGSFTGLRVGLATAWGLARSLGVPVESVSTLEGMAEAARSEGVTRLAAVLDAGRGEVVLQAFSLEQSRARPNAAARRLSRQEAIADGGRMALICLPADLLGPAGRAPAMPPSRAVALAVARAPRPGQPAGEGPRAIYSRASAAEEKHGAS